MTDIVERLRSDQTPLAGWHHVRQEAADAIKRLRAERDEWKQAAQVEAGERRASHADIDRLTATLQSLTVDPPATLDEPDTDAEVIIKMREIAREAMTDIVERLCTQPEDPLDLGTLLWEAADAIKRLRITVNDQAATITKLFEEVVKLQERLKRATTS